MKKKKDYGFNTIYGYDEKGKLISAYWQKDNIITKPMGTFKIHWTLRWNPIWRIKQWFLVRKPITFKEFTHDINEKS